jgi:hypothetical protein
MELLVDSNINQLMASMAPAEARAYRMSSVWVTRLTRYAERKMKYHAPSRTQRSTGNLKNSITSQVKVSGMTVEGIAYVPSTVGAYQFVVEGGRRPQGRRIYGYFSFPVQNWKKGRSNPDLRRYAHGGRFIFNARRSGIRMGYVKPNRFVAKSYRDLIRFYNVNRFRIEQNFIGTLFLSTSSTSG